MLREMILEWLCPGLSDHVARMEELHTFTKGHIRYKLTPIPEDE